jgi:type I restriction-modification system DNA methylase subunit
VTVNQGKVIESLEAICKVINRDEFIYQFLSAYGTAKTTLTRLRDGSRNIGINGDVGYKKNLYFRTVPVGTDVYQATEQLKSESVIASNQIRFVMVTDFDSLVAFDLKADETLDTDIRLLDKQYAFFLPLISGYEKAIMYSEHPADIKASEKMGQLFDLIRERNVLSKPEDIHALNVFLTRLLFCFYAEDTGIFQQDQMTKAIESTTSITGEDMDQFFTDLFTALNLPDDSSEKAKLASHFQAFPYVNGGLFRDDAPVPEFSTKARRLLLECGSLGWAEINPDIFGSMFQAVIDQEQRGNLGQHYTSVSNIMKVIKPLFLDKFWEALEQSRGKEKKLKELLVRLQNVRIFDPACGSGNFLIIAYKELRKIEMAVIDELTEASSLPVMYYSGISLSQFYGIEIDDFAHEVAILSLWLAEHQMNLEFKDKFGYADATLPLKSAGNIIASNALRIDWREFCPQNIHSEGQVEIFICGNPPFLGQRNHLKQHTLDMDVVFNGLDNYKNLDYVSCWFYKASRYIKKNTEAAFVATNSICQGSQVGMIWPKIFDLGVYINFGYKFFKWSNNAKQNAGVMCTIIGLTSKEDSIRKIYDSNGSRIVSNVSPYLIDAEDNIVVSQNKPISFALPMIGGNQPREGGFLTLSDHEKEKILNSHPEAERFIKPLLGTTELLTGKRRWCIWIEDKDVEIAHQIQPIHERIELVRKKRSSGNSVEINFKHLPHRFVQINRSTGHQIIIPNVSTSSRRYIPVGFISSDYIITNLANMIADADMFTFGIVNSEMHNSWVKAVAGRLGDGIRYAVGLCYNTYPLVDPSEGDRRYIEQCAESVILVREDYPDKTLADLYDIDIMPAPLAEAHKTLDRAVDKLYRSKPFAGDSERLEYLFGLYEQLIAKEKKGT